MTRTVHWRLSALRKFWRLPGTLAGAIIQIAKQGLALAHTSKREPAAKGRLIGTTQQLSHVIWQARNQTLHWEDRSFSTDVDDCFNKLAGEVDQVFSDYQVRNMALAVIKMLGWHTLADFEGDLISLG